MDDRLLENRAVDTNQNFLIADDVNYDDRRPRVVIGRDLRRAIEQLRAVPTFHYKTPTYDDSDDVWRQNVAMRSTTKTSTERTRPTADADQRVRRQQRPGSNGQSSARVRATVTSSVTTAVTSSRGSTTSYVNDDDGGRRASDSRVGQEKDRNVVMETRQNDERLQSSVSSNVDERNAAMPWKISRVRKQKLDDLPDRDSKSSPSMTNTTATTTTTTTTRTDGVDGGRPRRLQGPATFADSDDDILDDDDELSSRRESETTQSNESLDSIVERILESVAIDERRRSSKKKSSRPHSEFVVVAAEHPSTNGTTQRGANVDHLEQPPRHDMRPRSLPEQMRLLPTVSDTPPTYDEATTVVVGATVASQASSSRSDRSSRPIPPPKPARVPPATDRAPAAVNRPAAAGPRPIPPPKPVFLQAKPKRVEDTSLEDLFEAAVEGLTETEIAEATADDQWALCAIGGGNRKLRGEDNVEHEVYDDELHHHCHQYTLTTYVHRDVSQISRGFSFVQKVDKKTPTSPPTGQQNAGVEEVARGAAVDAGVAADGDGVGRPETSSSSLKVAVVASPRGADDVEPKPATVDRTPSFRQHTVISATMLTPVGETSSMKNGGVDAAAEPADASDQQQQQAQQQPTRGTSRSSSATWDTVSVDSLIVYDDETSTLRGIYSSQTQRGDAASTPVAAAEIDDERQTVEFVDSLRRLKRGMKQPLEPLGGDDDDGGIWIRHRQDVDEDAQPETPTEKTTNDVVAVSDAVDRKQKTDIVVVGGGGVDDVIRVQTAADKTSVIPATSTEVKILSEAVTTQQIVIKVKLPRGMRRPKQLVGPATTKIPFRELRLHREIRFVNDEHAPPPDAGTKMAVEDTAGHRLATSDDVTVAVSKAKDADEDRKRLPGSDVSSAVTSSSSSSDVIRSTALGLVVPQSEVEYADSVESRKTELVPVGDASKCSVDVRQSDSVTVLRVPSGTVDTIVYETPSLQQLVDGVRAAMSATSTGCSPASGICVTCEAVESIKCDPPLGVGGGGTASAPAAVVQNIVVNCLPETGSD